MSLRDKVVAEIATVNSITGEYIYTDLILPATAMQIEDALQKARITDSYDDMTDISIINCPYLPELTNTRIDGVNIKELNLFAKRVTILPENEVIALNGIFLNQNAQGKYDDGITMKELINRSCHITARNKFAAFSLSMLLSDRCSVKHFNRAITHFYNFFIEVIVNYKLSELFIC